MFPLRWTGDVELDVGQDSIQPTLAEVTKNERRSVWGQGRRKMNNVAHLVISDLDDSGKKDASTTVMEKRFALCRWVEWTQRNTQEFNVLRTERLPHRDVGVPLVDDVDTCSATVGISRLVR